MHLAQRALTQSSAPATRRIGPYELVTELRRDASGVVYGARKSEGAGRLRDAARVGAAAPRRRDDPPLALKLIYEASNRRRLRFLRETQALLQLRHPHVLGLRDAGEESGSLYLVTEYVHGCTLADLLAEETFSAGAAAELVRQVAEGVAHAHAASILHRDLRPERVLVDGDGFAQVCDFGLAGDAGEAGGGPFRAPEQVRGDVAAIGPRTDVYALGALLHACRSGEGPGGAAPPPDRRLDAIQDRCLALDPADRYPSAESLAEALHDYLDAPSGGASAAVYAVGALAGVLAVAVAVAAVIAATRMRDSTSGTAAVATSVFGGGELTPELKERDRWLRLGLQSGQQGDWKAAEQAFDEALALDATYGPVYTQRGRARREQGRLDAAEADFERAIDLMPNDPRPWYHLGLVHTSRDDLKAAEGAFDQAVKRPSPGAGFASKALNNRGMCRLRTRRFSLALQDFSAAVEADPRNARALLNAGLAHAELKNYPAAVTMFTRAIAVDPRYVKAFYRRAAALLKLERYPEAVADYTRCLELAPEGSWVYAKRARAHALNRAFREALADSQRALQSDPNDPAIYLTHLVILKALGRYDEAITAGRKALTLNPVPGLDKALRDTIKRIERLKAGAPPRR